MNRRPRPSTRRGLFLASSPPAIPVRPGRKADPSPPGWSSWLADPRSAVLFFLASALVIGGGRRLLQGARARRAIALLSEPEPSLKAIEAAADHGRAGLFDLFRLLGTAETPEARDAAGRTLARLWKGDELIVEEEKALVRRAFAVTWRARRRYPRSLKVPIPIEASYGIPFLVEAGPGVSPSHLEWSHRILGGERASLEEPSPWRAGTGSAAFEVHPADYPTNGPHRLALAAKVRVVGLTDDWELELPQIPFSFEFDPILDLKALLTQADEVRASALARSLRLEAPAGAPRFLDLDADFVIRDPPDLVVTTPLPCDLAHQLTLEFEDLPGRYPAGTVVVSGTNPTATPLKIPLGPIAGLAPSAFDRLGDQKIRAILTPDPDLGWADPDVRSLWPGELATEWATVRVIRK